jgi:hypothetical protein
MGRKISLKIAKRAGFQIDLRPKFSLRVRDLDIANVLHLMEQCSMSRTQRKIERMAMQR